MVINVGGDNYIKVQQYFMGGKLIIACKNWARLEHNYFMPNLIGYVSS
jgi:hypothetical protein